MHSLRMRGMLAWKLASQHPGRSFLWLGLWALLALPVTAAAGLPAGAITAVGGAFWSTIWLWPRRLIGANRRLLQVLDGAATDRLVLRRPRPDDAAGLAATMDAAFLEINGWPDRAKRHLLRVVERGVPAPGEARVLVTDRRSGEVIGCITAHGMPTPQVCHVGWWMGPASRGQGYGTEALGAAFAALHGAGVEHIVIGTSPGNAAVVRVLAKLGATELQRTLHRLPNGTTVPSIWYLHHTLPTPPLPPRPPTPHSPRQPPAEPVPTAGRRNARTHPGP